MYTLFNFTDIDRGLFLGITKVDQGIFMPNRKEVFSARLDPKDASTLRARARAQGLTNSEYLTHLITFTETQSEMIRRLDESLRSLQLNHHAMVEQMRIDQRKSLEQFKSEFLDLLFSADSKGGRP